VAFSNRTSLLVLLLVAAAPAATYLSLSSLGRLVRYDPLPLLKPNRRWLVVSGYLAWLVFLSGVGPELFLRRAPRTDANSPSTPRFPAGPASTDGSHGSDQPNAQLPQSSDTSGHSLGPFPSVPLEKHKLSSASHLSVLSQDWAAVDSAREHNWLAAGSADTIHDTIRLPLEMAMSDDPAAEASNEDVPHEMTEEGLPDTAAFAAYWNTWFEKGFCFIHSCRTRSVVAGADYRFVVSISNLELDAISAKASSGLSALLGKSPEPITLRIVPILTDDQIVLTGPQTSFPLPIDPKKLMIDHSALVKRVKEGSKAALDVVHQISAGSVPIPIHVSLDARGCSKIPLSIWLEGYEQAVDELVVPVSIGTSISDPNSCDSLQIKGSPNAPIVAQSLSGAKRVETDDSRGVALHIFDLDGSSYAVLRGQRGKESFFSSWQTLTPFTDAFAVDGDVINALKGAHERLEATATASDRAAAYAMAAKALRDHIFVGKDTDTARRQSSRGLKQFQDIVDEAPGVTMNARLSRTSQLKSSLYYAPLSMLAATGADIVKNGFDVVMPLPRGQQGQSCIAHWAIFASDEMGDLLGDPDAKAALTRITSRTPRDWLSSNYGTIKQFGEYMNPGESADGTKTAEPTEPQGLIVLAHHSANMGFFSKSKGEALTVNQLRRQFAPGSVAVLGSCSTGDPSSADVMIKHLNNLKFDSIVTSPYPVLAEYSVRLIDSFVSVLDEAYARGTEERIQDLFDKAATLTGESLATLQGDDKYLQEAMFEYVLAGNAEAHICGAPAKGK
jgi:hypothetical protein